VFGLSEEVERELVSLNDPVIVNGDRHKLDVLVVVDTDAIEVHVYDTVEADLIGCLHFATPAPLLL
jgi:hypothetical protein